MKARVSVTLAVGILVAALALFAAESRAGETSQTGASNLVQNDHSPASGPGDAQEVEAFFDGLIPEQLREEHLAGATVAVVDDGRTVFARGYGDADREKRAPVVADRTLFYPGSAGKLFTWTAVMQLVEEGKLDLDADVNAYLDFEIPGTYSRPITMEHLLTHTAGFEEQYAALLAETGQDVLPLRSFLTRYMPERVYPPGEYFAYSNYGTALAGYVVQRVSGEPYEQYVTEHILEPLSMERSAATQPLPDRLAQDLSKGYHYGGGTYEAEGFEWVSAVPAAPVHATATDMANFMLAHLGYGEYGGTRILRRETALEMHRQQFTQDPRLPGVAYGFIISRENDQHIIWHDGESARFSTILALLPEERTGVFVSYNTPFDARQTLSAFLDHFYPLEERPSPQPPADFQARAGPFAGPYIPMRVAYSDQQKIVGWLNPVRVEVGDRDLMVRSPLGDERYSQVQPGLFREVAGERLLTFREDGQGRVTHLFWGPLAYFKAASYQTLGFQLPFVVACLLLFASTLIVFPIAFVLRTRRGRGAAVPLAARAARWLAGITGALNLFLSAWLLLLLSEYAQTYLWPTETISTLTRLWLPSVPLTVGVVVLAVLAWRKHYWSAASRIHYTLVALAASLFVLFLGNWNLI